MSKYEWDLDYLYKMREDLKKMAENTNDPRESEELSFARDTYSCLIGYYDNRINDSNREESDDDFDYDFNSITVSSFINNTLRKIEPTKIAFILEAFEIAKKYIMPMTKQEKTLYPYDRMTNDDLVNITNQIYQSIPNKDFYNAFKEIIDSNKHLLHIKNSKKIPLSKLGLTIVDTYNHIPYAIVARNNSIEDILTLTHECAHMILNKNYSSNYFETKQSVYGEVEGYFMELLANTYLQNIGFPESVLNSYLTFDLQNYINQMVSTFIAKTIIENTDEQDNVDINKVNAHLSDKNPLIKIGKYDAILYTNEQFEYWVDDCCSYLTSLDLYNLYLKDPEKAIYDLIQIQNLSGENPRSELSSIDVTFFNDGYSNFNKHCQKLLGQKKTVVK